MSEFDSSIVHNYAQNTPQCVNPNGAPDGLYVLSEWITKEEEKDLCNFLGSREWVTNISSKRPIQHFGYKYNRRGHFNDHTKVAGDWGLLETYSKRFETMFPGIKIDQALANLYHRDAMIGPHTDTETSIVFGISLAGDINMIWSRMQAGLAGTPPVKIKYEACIPARSLYIMIDDAATMWKHEIPSRKTVKYPDLNPESPTYGQLKIIRDKGENYTRASLTFRRIIE